MGTKNVAGKIDEDDTDAEESDSDDKYGDSELDRYALICTIELDEIIFLLKTLFTPKFIFSLTHKFIKCAYKY